MESKCRRQRSQQASSLDVVWCPSNLDLSILPLLSVPERLDLLCRTDREVALRAAARYIDLLLHHHVYGHVCVCSLILLLQKGHQCSAGYLRNQ